jgi:hypothetical protein
VNSTRGPERAPEPLHPTQADLATSFDLRMAYSQRHSEIVCAHPPPRLRIYKDISGTLDLRDKEV